MKNKKGNIPLRADTVFEKFVFLFVANMRRKGFSAYTIRNQTASLRKFFTFLADNKQEIITIDTITRKEILEYQNFLFNSGISTETMAQYLGVLPPFFRFLVQEEYLFSNPAGELEMPKLRKTLPKNILSESEMAHLLGSINTNSALGMRDRALVEVLYSTGIRISECLNLQIEDVLEEEGMLRINQGKGNKDRIIPIGNIALKFLKYYLLEVRAKLVRDETHAENRVFVNYEGRRIPFTGNVNKIIRKLLKKAGIKKKATCHTFRHTCATHMLKGKASVRHVQEQLGHKSIVSTQKYLRVDISELKKVHAKCHPRERKQ